jgi:3-hydroxyisobutyrate dehydrogenase-like beta-hydroxyacid dehydrogenase
MMNPVNTNSVKLGFIGTGNMGSRIARRLLGHGYALTAYDRNFEKASALTTNGAAIASSIADLTHKADVVLSCLTNDDAVRSIYLGPDGVLANARSGSIVLEMSTVSPGTSRELCRLGFARGLNVLDIAISGSTPSAEHGTLTLLAGGSIEVFDAVESIFQAIAQQYFYLGPSGSGTTMKLVVNTLLGVGMQTVAEAVAFGQKAGLDRNLLLDVLAKTAVIAPALAGKLGRVSREDYSPQFPLPLMNKDFRLILETAAEMKVPMPATAAAFQINSTDFGSESKGDFSIVVELMEALARLRPPRETTQADSIDKHYAHAVVCS